MGKGAAALTHGNLIMVTSALPGEGKSFTSINLAMSIAAELDHTVMLVDADVARPSVLRMLGLPAGPGLLDLLEGKAEMSGVLLKTNVDKLTILPSGTPHPRATELLASDAMRLLLDDMAKRYPDRIIIFDSPPLLLTTESRVLATQMGQVVMVVQADKTLQADVQHALSTIESCPVKMMVLNKARSGCQGRLRLRLWLWLWLWREEGSVSGKSPRTWLPASTIPDAVARRSWAARCAACSPSRWPASRPGQRRMAHRPRRRWRARTQRRRRRRWSTR